MAERLWRDVHERLTAFVAQRVDDPADVADLVQAVFLRVHRHAGSVNDEERMLPWLFQVTRNAIADHYRSPVRRREVSLSALDETGQEGSAEDAGDGALSELAACVRPMVEQLPPMYREALTLVEFEGQSQSAVAAKLGVSVSGMKSRVQRGRSLLREVLLECCEVSRSATGGVLDYAPRATPVDGARRLPLAPEGDASHIRMNEYDSCQPDTCRPSARPTPGADAR